MFVCDILVPVRDVKYSVLGWFCGYSVLVFVFVCQILNVERWGYAKGNRQGTGADHESRYTFASARLL